MGTSLIEAQRRTILSTINEVTKSGWKVLVLDPDSRRLLDNVVDEDTLLNENITNIEQILERRPTNRDVDALYFLTPKPHIVDCIMADFQKRKYRCAHLVWTSLLHPALRDRIDKSQTARDQIAQFTVLNVEFFPRESHMVTFRDPWSFPILFHPGCSNLVRQHLEDMAQKIVGVCVALGDCPTIRYYRPRHSGHGAGILCSHLAKFTQDELNLYKKYHPEFPPQSNRQRATLYIVDRSMDLISPFVHEFTYQAMAHDLLPIRESDKVTYRTVLNEGAPNEEVKDIAITEEDKIWLENRHRHMKDVIEKLMADFQKFIKDNPNFTQQAGDGSNSLSAIKDMMAGLPEFQNRKEAYALHLGMAQESMNRFQKFKLPDLSSVEQICATGLDEDFKKPKGLADQVIRMLDEDDVTPPDRLRLLILYTLYRDGILPADLDKLLAHAKLGPQDHSVIHNLELLGARTTRGLKDKRPPPPPLFEQKPPPPPSTEEYLLSRFEPALQSLLEAHAQGNLDETSFPFTIRPPEFANEAGFQSASSLRSAKPTWARTTVKAESRQRVIVMVAGGATYAESRACYETGRATSREVFLVTSHMLTPSLFLRQVADLSSDRRRLGLPADQPMPQAPKHLFESDEPTPQAPQVQPIQPQQQQQQSLTRQMAGVNLNGQADGARQAPVGIPGQGRAPAAANASSKLTKDPEKKKRHHFGFGKK